MEINLSNCKTIQVLIIWVHKTDKFSGRWWCYWMVVSFWKFSFSPNRFVCFNDIAIEAQLTNWLDSLHTIFWGRKRIAEIWVKHKFSFKQCEFEIQFSERYDTRIIYSHLHYLTYDYASPRAHTYGREQYNFTIPGYKKPTNFYQSTHIWCT